MNDRLFELAALDAAGALIPDEQRELRALIGGASAPVKREVASLYDSAGALPAGLELERPSAAVRDRILAHAARHGAAGDRG
jgi:hypothetical protein